MIAGQYVLHQGRVHQVLSMTGGKSRNWGGSASTDRVWALKDLADPTKSVYVRNPGADDLPPTPACEECGVGPGYCRGTDPHYRALQQQSTCGACGGQNGRHGMVHRRHGNGGGSNVPCPNAPAPFYTSGEPW